MRKQLHQRENLPWQIKAQIEQESHGICAHCGKRISRKDKTMTIEHIIPLHKGGTNEPNNLAALCRACNVDKGDDIIDPGEFYPYLPKSRRKSVKKAFEAYLKNTDCFSCDTLFLLDRFSIPVKWRPRNAKGGRYQINTVSKQFRIEKFKPDDAMNAILIYAARLSYEDKGLFPNSADELVSPYYKITSGNTYYGFCCPVVRRASVCNENGEETEETPYIALEIFFNPDLHPRDDTMDDYWNLAQIILGLMREIQRTLSIHHSGTAITTRVLAPKSDKTMYNIWDYFISALGWQSMSAEGTAGGSVLAVESVMYIGDSIALQHLSEKAHGTKSITALTAESDSEAVKAAKQNLIKGMEGHKSIESKEKRAAYLRDKKKKRKKKKK